MVEQVSAGDAATRQKVAADAVSGVLWLSGATYLSYFVNLIVGIFLARLLDPADFGVVSLAEALLGILLMFSAWGITNGIMYRGMSKNAELGTALTISIFLGLGIGLIIVILALIWRATEPLAATILIVLGIAQIPALTTAIPIGLLQIGMRFPQVARLQFVGTTAEMLVALTGTLLGFGVWALVSGRIAALVVNTIGLWLLSPWRPRLAFDRAMARWFFDYGKNLFVADNISAILVRFDDLMVGTLAGKAALGFYSRAYMLGEAAVQIALPNFGRVTEAVFIKLRDDHDALSRSFALAGWGILHIMVPFVMVIGLLAPEAIRLVYGEKWLATAPILRILLAYTLILPLHRVSRTLLVAVGRQETLAKIYLLDVAIFVPAIVVVTAIAGARGTAAVVVIVAAIGLAIRLKVTAEYVKLRRLSDGWPALVAGILALVASYWLRHNLLAEMPLVYLIGATGTSYLLVYVLFLWVLERRRLRESWQQGWALLRGGTI